MTVHTETEQLRLSPREVLRLLSLEDKASLLAGKDAWHFPGVESFGLPAVQVADCGHGLTLVCAPWGSASCLPTSVGMAATWNRDLLFEAGQLLGREARAKGCGMLLGPMVNLHRLPMGGRNYETFSEDPLLTGVLSGALIRGIQSEGTSACIKSFLCNNQQKNQHYVSSEVDERTLREIYLKVFIIALKEGDPWAVMTSYNAANGEYPADSGYWLQSILRDELGFEGFVVSDWNAVKGEGAFSASLDMEMPGPGKVLHQAGVLAAIDSGRMSVEDLDRSVLRLLELYEKILPAQEGDPRYSPPELDSTRHRELTRRIAEESIVLLKNEGSILPLNQGSLKRIAVIGPNASTARLGGGGSASVLPFYSVSPLEGIRAYVGEGVEVVYAEGCSLDGNMPLVPASMLAPDENRTFGEGLRAEYFINEEFESGRPPRVVRNDHTIDFSWGWAAPANGLPRGDYTIRWSGHLRSGQDTEITLGLSTKQGIARLWVNDELVIDCWSQFTEENFEDKFTDRQGTFSYRAFVDQPIRVRLEYRKTGYKAAFRFGWRSEEKDNVFDEALELARTADAVVFAGGISNMYEGGNHDRESFQLPGQQVELINKLVEANPRTIVTLNNGTPVDFRGWSERVPAILEAFYPGQEGGNALARILFGAVNPSGRLPDTMPMCWEDVTAVKHYPGAEGKAYYKEGLFVGYRDYDAQGLAPAYPFGFGLSYTRYEYGTPDLVLERGADGVTCTLSIEISNTGRYRGKETVQLYVGRKGLDYPRPPNELLDFKKIELEAGESQKVRFVITEKDLWTYCIAQKCWRMETSHLRFGVGPHSRDLKYIEVDVAG